MGKRLIDHFFATSDKIVYCKKFSTAMQVVADSAFKKFLGQAAECTKWDAEKKSCSLVMANNPLGDFVMMPTGYRTSLWYSNIMCGIIRGALEMINMKVNASFVSDNLRDQGVQTEIRVQLIEVIQDKYDSDDD